MEWNQRINGMGVADSVGPLGHSKDFYSEWDGKLLGFK